MQAVMASWMIGQKTNQSCNIAHQTQLLNDVTVIMRNFNANVQYYH